VVPGTCQVKLFWYKKFGRNRAAWKCYPGIRLALVGFGMPRHAKYYNMYWVNNFGECRAKCAQVRLLYGTEYNGLYWNLRNECRCVNSDHGHTSFSGGLHYRFY